MYFRSASIRPLICLLFSSFNPLAALAQEHQLFFPQVALFADFFTSTFIVSNPEEVPIQVRLEFLDDSGQVRRDELIQVPGQGTTRLVLQAPEGTILVGWARLSSDSEFEAAEIFQRFENGLLVDQAGVLPSPSIDHFRVFVDIAGTSLEMSDTGLAAANPSSDQESVLTVRLRTGPGIEVATRELTLSPLSQTARFISRLFSPGTSQTADPLDFSNFEGVAEITASQPVVAMALQDNGGQLATLPISGSMFGSITAVNAGNGLQGGGSSGEISLSLSDHVSLGDPGNSGMLTVYSENGNKAAIMSGALEAPLLAVNNSSGELAVAIGSETSGGAVEIFGTQTDTPPNPDTQPSGITLEQQAQLRLASTDSGGALEIRNSQGLTAAIVDVDQTGSGRVSLHRQESELVVLEESANTSSGSVKVNGSNGTELAEVASTLSGGGFMVANSPSGKTNAILSHPLGDPESGLIGVFDRDGTFVAGIDGSSGNVFGNSKSFLVPDPDNPEQRIRYTALEGPEAGIYLRGTANLREGFALVPFPDHFRVLAIEDSITVTLTPRSSESEGLAVKAITPQGLEVLELRGGHGSYQFDYSIFANRQGFEAYQVYVPKKLIPR